MFILYSECVVHFRMGILENIVIFCESGVVVCNCMAMMEIPFSFHYLAYSVESLYEDTPELRWSF